MSELERIEELEKEIRKLKGLNEDGIPIFSFSKITFEDLESVINIEQNYDTKIFNNWFNQDYNINLEEIEFLEKLIRKT
jgi:hypothetical protein